jgi:hypothetical protein
MFVDLRATRTFRCPADAAFALALDPERFPATFRGCGPIPAVRRITLHAPPAVGSTRELENSDGSRPLERILVLDPPHRHAYLLSNLNTPFAWLVRTGYAEWSFSAAPEGSAVRWRYRFELTTPLAWPIAFPLLRVFMTTAMRRCLAAMASMLEAPEAAP